MEAERAEEAGAVAAVADGMEAERAMRMEREEEVERAMDVEVEVAVVEVEAADGVEAVKERVVEVERAASRRPERAVVGRVCGEYRERA